MTNIIDFSERQTDINVAPIFLQRWSPRAFQKHIVNCETMERIMEAARWSPSCFNAQPWRFFTSSESTFSDFLDLLVEGNQRWAKNASVLGFIVAERYFEHNGKPNNYDGFDSGAAWMSMTLQARMEGLYTHGMGGIKEEAVAEYLQLDNSQFRVLMGFAIGKLVNLDSLDAEQRAKEKPTGRLALSDIWQIVG